jgi:hypothetical protein
MIYDVERDEQIMQRIAETVSAGKAKTLTG